ncbi:MAG TPA: TMEM175 family protein [Acidimicrobiia bacterium]|nr:TMEM175 family protein [Acidimicrobiia bacterium]
MSSESRERTLELDRLVNFSDAVFAIAATLLVLNIRFSFSLGPPDLDRKLWHEFGDALPQVLAYALSFFVIARIWLGHHRMFKLIQRIDGRFIALNLAVLGLIALVPFPTEVYGNYPQEQPALIVYCVAISAPSVASAVMFHYAAQGNRLTAPSTPREWVIHSQLRALSIPAVFLSSIPISFISVGLAQLWWLWMVPLRVYLARRYGKVTDVWA